MLNSVYNENKAYLLSLNPWLCCLQLWNESKEEGKKGCVSITANQIAFYNARETERHNRATEDVQKYSADAAHRQASVAEANAREVARHNVESERVNWWNAGEVARHNIESENQAAANLRELAQHNRAQEQINWFDATSQARYRSAQAVSLARQAAVSERNAAVAERNAATRESELAESIRHSLVGEAELARHNMRVESLNAQIASENARANRAREAISYSQYLEQQRSNMAGENIRQQQVSETHRANVVGEFYQGLASSRANTQLEHDWWRTQQQISQGATSLGIQQQNADTAAYNADTSRYHLYNDVASTIIQGYDTVADNSREGVRSIFQNALDASRTWNNLLGGYHGKRKR